MLQDIKQTLRNIANAPVFYGTVILTLALGIGANSAIFSVVKTVLLEPLPYPQAAQIIGIADYPWIPTEIYLDLKQSTSGSFEEIAAIYRQPVALTDGDQPREVEAMLVTPNFFRVLRTELLRGRHFTQDDAHTGARVAALSHSTWQAGYAGRKDDRHISINSEPHELVAVTAPDFRQITPGTENPQLWIPTQFEPATADGSLTWTMLLARLKPGVDLQQAQAELDVVMSRFRDRHPEIRDFPRWNNLRLTPIQEELVRNVRPALLMLQLAVAVVLLIACVNVANLLQARFGSRQREFAMRAALGATKARIVRQLVTESVVLSILGGLCGFLLMLLSLELLVAIAPADIPRIAEVSGDWSVFLFAMAISVGTGFVFGVFPAMLATRKELFDVIKEGGRAPAQSKGQRRASQVLIVVEVALTLVLLVGAGLLIRSFSLLTGQSLGFHTEGVTAAAINVPERRYGTLAELEEFYRRAVDRIALIPGVQSASVSNNLPISRARSTRDFIVEGESQQRTAEYAVVSPGYFEVLKIPLLRGRDIEHTDRRTTPNVTVIDEGMARAIWPNQDPLGKRLRFADEEQWMTIVGIVANSRGSGLGKEPGQGFYISNQQRPDNLSEFAVGRHAFFLIQSQLPAEDLADALRAAIWEIDPLQPLPTITPLSEIIADGARPQQFRASLLGIFAALAVILVVAGIYGVVEYVIVERTHELGIRKALGASAGDIVAMMLKWGLRLTLIGVMLGLLGVFFLDRFIATLLFGVKSTDVLTIGLSMAAVAMVALAACFVPARRIAAVDPSVALRADGRSSTSKVVAAESN
jgi:putative ABC transport system permease protein